MNFLMTLFKMTCKDVYPLISEKMDHPLSLIGRVRLKMHLAICSLCHIYSKQLQTLQNLARNLGKEDSQAIEKKTLNPDTKEKIQKYIKDNS
jgi:hypothetical protein